VLVLADGDSELFLEVLVEISEIFCKLLSCNGRNIVDSDFERRVVSFVSKKRRNTCSGMGSVVIREFSEREKRNPIILRVVAVHPQVQLQDGVDSFRLSVRFRMVGGREIGSDI